MGVMCADRQLGAFLASEQDESREIKSNSAKNKATVFFIDENSFFSHSMKKRRL